MWLRASVGKATRAAKNLRNANLCCIRKNQDSRAHRSMATQPSKPVPTPCVLLSSDKAELEKFLTQSGIGPKGGSIVGNPVLQFVPAGSAIPPVTDTNVPVVFNMPPGDAGKFVPFDFNWSAYRDNLVTKDYGKVVIYGDVVTSTMDIANPLLRVPTDMSTTAIATEQTGGRGGGGKAWPSPKGEAMFTLRDCFPTDSPVSVNRHALESIAAAAAVKAIRGVPGLAALDIYFVWPRSVYVGNDKIGGVLVEYAEYDNKFLASIGVGIFVDAPHPSLNDFVKRQFPEHPALSVEEVLGRTVTSMEQMISRFHAEGAQFLPEVTQYWAHKSGEAKVQFSADGRTTDANIHGFSEDGFLVVSSKSGDFKGERHLHPGMYKFDIRRNMILRRHLVVGGKRN